MCGIAGFCNRRENWKKEIAIMKARMAHRGPDAEGTWASEDAGVVLGHRRLAILDLSPCGAQPMLSHSGRYVIAYNGEIYNYPEIREKLRSEGHLPYQNSASDTEVLLEALEAYGVREGIGLCKGMFAIALYDTWEKELWLLRDRVGEKPLYYGFVGDSFVFASEIGCIAALPGFRNPINQAVLNLYMIYGYIPAPHSIYEGIYKLEPGKLLHTRAPFREFAIETWWSMAAVARAGQAHPFAGSRQEAGEELERLLKNAIRGQMLSDVPLGAFLSAGIDSTTVVSLMQSLSDRPVKTFTIGMQDREYDEAAQARKIAAHLGTDHTDWYISEKEAKEVLPKLPFLFGEPFADSSQIPTYLVSQLTRKHVTVSLSGDGGDELFCGYRVYPHVFHKWERIHRVPLLLRRCVSRLMTEGILARQKQETVIRGLLLAAKNPEDLYRLSDLAEPFLGELAKEQKTAGCVMTEYESGFLPGAGNNLMLIDLLMYHPDDILVKVDRTAMAVSLESRVPLLDRDVVEFAWTLPFSMKYSDGTGKQVLRDVLYRYVPKELMDRPKKGFSVPISRWLKEPELYEWAQSLLDREKIRREGYLDPDGVKRLWDDFAQRGIWRKQIWHLLQFEEWLAREARGVSR